MEGEREGESSNVWWPMEKEGEGCHVWWLMEGEGEGSNAFTQTFIFSFDFKLLFYMVIGHYLCISFLFLDL